MYQAKHMAGEAKHLAAKKRKRHLFRRPHPPPERPYGLGEGGLATQKLGGG